MRCIFTSLFFLAPVLSLAAPLGGSGGGSGGLGGSFPAQNFLIKKTLGNSVADWKDLRSRDLKDLMDASLNAVNAQKEDKREVAQVVLRAAFLDNFSTSDTALATDWWERFLEQEYSKRVPNSGQCRSAIASKNIDAAADACGVALAGISLKGNFFEDLGIQRGDSLEKTTVAGKPYMEMNADQLQLILQRSMRRVAPDFLSGMAPLNEDRDRDFALQLVFRRLAKADGINEEARMKAVGRWFNGPPNRFWNGNENAMNCMVGIREARAEAMDKSCGFERFSFKSILR